MTLGLVQANSKFSSLVGHIASWAVPARGQVVACRLHGGEDGLARAFRLANAEEAGIAGQYPGMGLSTCPY
jgi:hypothetical protein